MQRKAKYICTVIWRMPTANPDLDNIEDDDEYEIVADAFDELLDDQEFDEIVGEDEI